jgi:hypothetical protein
MLQLNETIECTLQEITVELQKDYAPQTVRYVKVNLLGLFSTHPQFMFGFFLGFGCAFF